MAITFAENCDTLSQRNRTLELPVSVYTPPTFVLEPSMYHTRSPVLPNTRYSLPLNQFNMKESGKRVSSAYLTSTHPQSRATDYFRIYGMSQESGSSKTAVHCSLYDASAIINKSIGGINHDINCRELCCSHMPGNTVTGKHLNLGQRCFGLL